MWINNWIIYAQEAGEQIAGLKKEQQQAAAREKSRIEELEAQAASQTRLLKAGQQNIREDLQEARDREGASEKRAKEAENRANIVGTDIAVLEGKLRRARARIARIDELSHLESEKLNSAAPQESGQVNPQAGNV